MFKVLRARLAQRHRTTGFPLAAPPALPERYRGRLQVHATPCSADCAACVQVCPTAAITPNAAATPAGASARAAAPKKSPPLEPRQAPGGVQLDLGKCLFCGACVRSCPTGTITQTTDYRLATRRREELLLEEGRAFTLATALSRELMRLYGRSLKLRQVSAGGCNACEADINVLGTIAWDMGRFGINVVASPRHADGLLVTGPVTRNMAQALRDTYAALAAPKLVIAVGTCAISGGLFTGHDETLGGIDGYNETLLGQGETAFCLPVDLYIPGCPPHPLTILDGLLRLLGRV